MNVVISNVFSDDNKGGALLTQATIRLVRSIETRASLSLLLIAPDHHGHSVRHTLATEPSAKLLQPPLADLTARLGGIAALVASLLYLLVGPGAARLHPSLKALAHSDVVVSKGGHVFVERYGLRGLMSLWVTAFPLLYGARCGAITILSGATIGPFSSRSSLILNRLLLKRAHLILPRDSTSYENATALGLGRSRIILVPDGLFGIPIDVDHHKPLLDRYALSGVRFAVVTTGAFADEEPRFAHEVASCLRALADEDLIDEVVVPLHVVSPAGDSSDRELSTQLIDALHPLAAQIIDADHSPEELMALYQSAVIVMGRRLHSTLFGLLVGTPVVAVVHPRQAMKARAIFEDLTLGDWVADLTIPGQLCEIARELIMHRADCAKRAERAVARMQAAWRAAVNEVHAALRELEQ